MGNRAEELAVYGKPGKRWCCFPPFPQTLEIARREHRNMKILRSDSHIPSAPAASMNQFQIPKGQNPLRLLFASFRLILGLEKTLPLLQHVQQIDPFPFYEPILLVAFCKKSVQVGLVGCRLADVLMESDH